MAYNCSDRTDTCNYIVCYTNETQVFRLFKLDAYKYHILILWKKCSSIKRPFFFTPFHINLLNLLLYGKGGIKLFPLPHSKKIINYYSNGDCLSVHVDSPFVLSILFCMKINKFLMLPKGKDFSVSTCRPYVELLHKH